MVENSLIERDLQTWLETVSENYVAAYDEIVADQERKVLAARPKSNAELRKAAYNKAIHTMDRKELASMGRTVRGFLPLAKANSVITATTGVLDEAEAEDLMVEVLEVKRLEELAKARKEAIRQRVFNSITESFAEQGEEFPEHVAGYIEVPKLGLKFTREGGGRKDPELDEAKLEALVGPKIWKKVTTVEYIPAQEVRSFDADLFLQEARRNTGLLEELRESLTVGEFGTPRFYQRAMDPDEE